MYVECGQWYHPRLVIKANISTLCNHSPPTRGGHKFPFSVSFSFFLFFQPTTNKQSARPIPPLFLSTPMSTHRKNKTQKEKKTKRHRGE